MPQQDAIEGERLTEWSVTEDGGRVHLAIEDTDGQARGLSLPVPQLNALMMTIPRMLRRALDARFDDGSLRMIQSLGGWKLERAAGTESFILSLATPDGFEVSFGVPPEQAEALAEALGRAQGNAAQAGMLN